MTINNALNANAATPLSLIYGGTGGSLTASNGGIFYSTASAAAVLAGTSTANQILLSGSSTTPAWSTATHPATTTINQILYSSANNVISGLTTANNGVVITSSGGVPSISSTLPSAVTNNIPGRLLAIQIFTVGTTTYTPTSGTNSVRIKAWGAGGGGGSTNNADYGGGGGAGAYVEAFFANTVTRTVVVGAGGAGGTANNATNGGNGNNTTFGSTILVAAGGTGAVSGGNPGGAGGTIGNCTIPSVGFAFPGAQGGGYDSITNTSANAPSFGNLASTYPNNGSVVGIAGTGQGGVGGTSAVNATAGGSGYMVIYDYS